MSPKLDPNGLEINTNLNPQKLQQMGGGIRPCHEPIAILRDFDGTEYVVDGNHRAALAREQGVQVEGSYVPDEYKVGNQTALERVIGIFFRGSERR